tara:strand:+ start:313 stop:468 length:156 start_codon:yes stop_codon:yes gene_type:complete
MSKINLGILLVLLNLIITVWLGFRIESVNSSLDSVREQIQDIDVDIHELHE